MKGVVIAAIIAAAVAAGSIAYTRHMNNVSEELGDINSSVMECLENEDYKKALEEIERLTDYLDDRRATLAATGNHEELDKIEMNISQMLGYAEGGHKTDAISHCKVLSFLFEHLPKNYEMKLENIL